MAYRIGCLFNAIPYPAALDKRLANLFCNHYIVVAVHCFNNLLGQRVQSVPLKSKWWLGDVLQGRVKLHNSFMVFQESQNNTTHMQPIHHCLM